MIATRGRGDLQALFDKSKVLVEVAIELGGESVVFEGQFKLRGKGVVGSRRQVPVQTVLFPVRRLGEMGHGLRQNTSFEFGACDNLAFN
jgi:hypothetical protein